MFLSNDTASASDRIWGIASGVLFWSLPSKILIPSKTALWTALSLQNFSVVSDSHWLSASSNTSEFNNSLTPFSSSSLISFLWPSSINKVSFVGKFLYLLTKLSISPNKILSSLLEK